MPEPSLPVARGMDRRGCRLRRLLGHLAEELPVVPWAASEAGNKSAFLAPVPSTREHYSVSGCDEVGLSPAEAAHFREFGYIIKRGLIPQEALQPFVDLWWEQPPAVAARLSPADKHSWVQPGRHWPKAQRWATSRNWLGASPWPV